MPVKIGCIVEGHGEVQALPELLRRLAQKFAPALSVEVPHPLRWSRGRLVQREGELERAIEFMARRVGAAGALLILLDADEDCPAELGPELLSRAREARPDLPVSVVLPKREFEAWFLAAAESLRGRRGLPVDLEPPEDPEGVQGAKEWLARYMPRGSYTETLDQAALAAVFDIDLARQRSESFDKLCREVAHLLDVLSARRDPADG